MISKESEEGVRKYHLRLREEVLYRDNPKFFSVVTLYCCVVVPGFMWLLYDVLELI